ncbi:MAG: helix-turn-helix transcriptional regulator [Bacteroidaceae bacterium]|nr:helix-turn-helix transcriptional regulator [Bacteroidaceae bacterium]
MERHINDPDLNVSKLCRLVHMDRSLLYRHLMATTSSAPLAFLHNYRQQKAYELMNTRLTLYEIADAVGYDSYRLFTKHFKAIYGVTPYEFRSLRKSL